MDENNNVVKQYELENDVETNVIEFVYDSENTPVYFVYNEMIYYYEKNIQGDIVSIVDENGNTVVEYIYNIWGELCEIIGELADTIGVANPLRYRGYYYDTEVGLYYLQSRYYAPDLMRFISQDDVKLSNAQGEPLGSNLHAYCLNNPVMNSDPEGEIPRAFVAVAGICAALFIKTFALSIAMYAYAATGARVSNNIELSEWWNPIGKLMKNRLKNSKLIKERINSYIRKINYKSYSKKEHINFAD